MSTNPEPIATTKELAKHFGCSERWIRELRSKRVIKWYSNQGESVVGRFDRDASIKAIEEFRKASKIRRQAESGSAMGWVYFLQSGSLLKIGYASNLRNRLKDYPSQNPHVRFIGAIPGTFQDENNLHKEFENYRYKVPGSREWFCFDGSLKDYVTSLFVSLPA